MSWDDFGVVPIEKSAISSNKHQEWLTLLGKGELSEVAVESLALIETGDNDLITARFFAETIRLRGNTADFQSRLNKLYETSGNRTIVKYLKLCLLEIQYRKTFDKLVADAETGRKIDDAFQDNERMRLMTWNDYNSLGSLHFPFLVLLSQNGQASLDARRAMALKYLTAHSSDRDAKLVLARLYAAGTYSPRFSIKNNKPLTDKWGNKQYFPKEGNAPDFKKAFDLLREIETSDKADSRTTYYFGFLYAQRYQYESMSSGEKGIMLKNARTYFEKYLKMPNGVEALENSARLYLKSPRIDALDLRLVSRS